MAWQLKLRGITKKPRKWIAERSQLAPSTHPNLTFRPATTPMAASPVSFEKFERHLLESRNPRKPAACLLILWVGAADGELSPRQWETARKTIGSGSTDLELCRALAEGGDRRSLQLSCEVIREAQPWALNLMPGQRGSRVERRMPRKDQSRQRPTPPTRSKKTTPIPARTQR